MARSLGLYAVIEAPGRRCDDDGMCIDERGPDGSPRKRKVKDAYGNDTDEERPGRLRFDLIIEIGSRRIGVDVAIVHVGCPSWLARSSPLEARERDKWSKYGSSARWAGMEFMPFVISHLGGFGQRRRETATAGA